MTITQKRAQALVDLSDSWREQGTRMISAADHVLEYLNDTEILLEMGEFVCPACRAIFSKHLGLRGALRVPQPAAGKITCECGTECSIDAAQEMLGRWQRAWTESSND